MKKLKWIIQNNLIKPEVLKQFKEAFETLNIDYEEVQVIPFSMILPAFSPVDQVVFYGSTTLMLTAYENEQYQHGVFYDPLSFSMKSYLHHWGNYMLNAEGQVMTFEKFIKTTVDTREEWFLRPNEDDKSFAGTVMSSSEIKEWYEKILQVNNPQLHADTNIMVAPTQQLIKEWRNIVIDGKVIDSSRYMCHGKLQIQKEDCPPEMLQFVEKQVKVYAPNDIFVIDIAETNQGYKIIECNCFNGTGFYEHNIQKIVKSITDKLKKE